jgi:hypothetical protein
MALYRLATRVTRWPTRVTPRHPGSGLAGLEHRVGERSSRLKGGTLLFAGVGATGLGIISDLYEIGHPSELFIALTWMLAARAARRDALLASGLLLGLSAGFETWGLLGAPILFLMPSTRRTIGAGSIAVATAATIYAPFALGGDFHMFDLHWGVTGGIDGALFGQRAPFTWQMRMVEAILVVSFGSGLALALRQRTAAAIWIVPAATSIFRLFLDPVRYPYYWDTGLMLILLGTAPWVSAPRQLAADLKATIAMRIGHRRSPLLLDPSVIDPLPAD